MTEHARKVRFEAIVREVVDPVRRYLVRRTDEATADDVLSETLLVLWRRLDDVPDEPVPYAYGVARRALANAERSARRQRRVAGKVAALDPPREVDDGAGDAPDVVREALGHLGAQEAELLRLWAWEQLTPAMIAPILGITPNAVSIRLLRAKAKLADEIRKIEASTGHDGAGRGSA